MKTRRGYLYQKKPGGTWYVRTRIDGKSIVRSTRTKSKREAEKSRSKIMEPYALGDKAKVYKEVVNKLEDTNERIATLNEPPPLAINTVWIKYIKSNERPDSGDATLGRYHSIWKRFEKWVTVKHVEIESLDQITEQLTDEYANSLKTAKYAPSTFNQHKNFLKLHFGVLLPHKPNPWQRIKSRRLNTLATRKKSLTPSQYENLLAATEYESDMYDLLVTLAWTGLRLIDATLMRWSEVDFKDNVITIAPQKTKRRQAKIVYIPMFPAVLEVLNRRQSGTVLNPAAFVFPELAAIYQRDKSVLSRQIGAVFTKAGMQTSIAQADRKLALVRYGAHSFRHFFVSVASAAGMPSVMIKSITGHDTDSMLSHYQHIGKDLAADLSKRIGGYTAKDAAVLPDLTQLQPSGGVDVVAGTPLNTVTATLESLSLDQLEAVVQKAQALIEVKRGVPVVVK